MPQKFCTKCLDEEEETLATHHCPTCSVLLCEVHLMLHNKVAKTKGHASDIVIVSLEDEEDEKKSIQCQMCLEDDEENPALYFCPVCKLNICELHLTLHNKMSKTKGHEKEIKTLGESGLSTCSHCQAHCSDDFIDAVYSCRECKAQLCYHHAKIHSLACNHAKSLRSQCEGCSQLDTDKFRLLAENKFKQFAGDFQFVAFLGCQNETQEAFSMKGNSGNQPSQFKKPQGLKINIHTKEVFVCDSGNSRIQVFDLTTRDFKRQMWFSNFAPTHLDFDFGDDTMVIVSDNQVVAKYTMDGRTLIWDFGRPNGYGNTDDTFENPHGVVVDNDGDRSIYIAEQNSARVKVLSPDGKFVKHLAEKQLWTSPMGLAWKNGNLLVNSYANGHGQIAELTTDGECIKILGKKQDFDPELYQSSFMCVERFSGNIVIADTSDMWWSPIKFIKGQSLLKLETKRGLDKLQFSSPTGIDIDPYTGYLYVSDCENNRVQILK